MPGEPGETGMMESAVLGWVSQGLQHEVIAMASCCKKGGGQKGNNCHRQTCSGTTGITVLRRDSGAACRIRTCDQPLRMRLLYPTELMPQRKEHCGGIEPHLHKPHFPDMLLTMPLSVVKICRGRINTALWLVSISGGSQAFHSAQLAVLNILVSSEVSHRTATMVSRCRACRAWLAHSGYPLGHVPRIPRTAIDACAIRRMLSHLEAHSAI